MPQALRPIDYSSRCSWRLAGVIAGLVSHQGNEQSGDAGRTHVAQRCQLPTVNMVEEQDAAPEHLAFVNRL
jgi:hypothetical protein